MNKINQQDIDTLARTIYGEARGELIKKDGGIKSLHAVGWVVKNRLKKKIYGNSIKDVCQKPWQFSCWNINDPNRNLIQKLEISDLQLQICTIAALQVLAEKVEDCTYGADHYHSKLIKQPFWADNSKITTVIADHIFYKLEV